MAFGDSPKSPSFKKDRRGWNAAWERDLASVYGSSIEISFATRKSIPSVISGMPTRYYEMLLADSHVGSLQTMTSQICILQRDLTRKASRRFAEDDFESHWKTRCSAKEREEFVLEGLVRACDASPDFEDHRKWCPELTLNRLNHNSGQGFIDLLKKLSLQDIDKVPDDIKILPNVVYDKINALPPNPHPGLVVAKKSCDCGRMYLLTMVVWNILLAFYDESETYGLVKGQREDREELARFQKLAGKEVDVKRVAGEVAANRKLAERHCTSCGLPASKAGVDTLLSCKRCKDIDRLVFYCSKKCQTADWKTGRPPHKTICGKEGAIRDAFFAPKEAAEPAPQDDDSDSDFYGTPSPGYTRSPALLHQLSLLKEHPQLDYVFVRPHPHPDHGVGVQDPLGKMFFKLCFKRAACEHSPREVCKMFQQLEPSARGAPGYGVQLLKKQLMKEFGVDVDVAMKECWPDKTG
ncbi:hypothetical protein R3P38DRAFT_2849066 [Favolaschia claudopus]|uniref:MYND-type domain-containing protein n=1 Tax=Favolaschia claudopus TaxID=2862362 RepID=A0AAW0DVX3_9AGAR